MEEQGAGYSESNESRQADNRGVPAVNQKEIKVGTGDAAYRVDSQGLYLGSEQFATAPFRVNMAGDITLSGGASITIGTTGYVRGGQTDYATGTGFFLGYSGAAYKFSVGNPSGDFISWDGSVFTNRGLVSNMINPQFESVDGWEKTISANGAITPYVGNVRIEPGATIGYITSMSVVRKASWDKNPTIAITTTIDVKEDINVNFVCGNATPFVISLTNCLE